MLSIGKHPPAPPCACDELIPPLNSDERASPSPQFPDLTHNPSLLNFSIRNHVFAARNKDISTNWPFSLRNLQLCLKHGVKDPLPPFQSLDNVRNQCFLRSSVKPSNSLNKEVSRSNSTEEPLSVNNDQDNTKSNDGLADNFPSTTTGVSQQETESVPANRQPNNHSVSVKFDTLLSTSIEKEFAGPLVPLKTESAVRLVGKKGQLFVKLNGNLERSSTEDIASTSTAVSDTMASKVCPVCKTFSSSSNTTLNAHIDQCLSEEPTPKWSAGSKVNRHRIKPRKTRLMVDIYETAQRCTLEDLDRRNGSNWAIEMSLPSQDAVVEKRQRFPSVKSDGDVGAVYIDSKGTKLRILSRFSDSQPSSSRAGETFGPSKCFKGKVNNVLLSKKKKKKKKEKPNAQKHHQHLKIVSQREDFHTHKSQLHGSQDFRDQEKYHGSRRDSNARLPVSRSQGPLQPCDNGNVEQSACSRRSGTFKKLRGNDAHPPVGCTLHVSRNLLVESGQSYCTNELISGGYDSDSPDQLRSRERMGVPASQNESLRKRKLRSPLFYGTAGNNVEESNFLQVKRRNGQSSDPFKFAGGHAFHSSNKTNILHIAFRKTSKSSGISPTKATRFSKMEKKVPSAFSLRRSKLDDTKKDSTAERLGIHLVGEMNEEDSDDLDPGPTGETTNKMSLPRSFNCSFEQDTGRTNTFQKLQYSNSDDEKNAESSVSLSADHFEGLGGQDSVVNKGQDHGYGGDGDNIGAFELQSKLGAEDNALNLNKHLNQGTPVENRRIHGRSSTEMYNVGSCHMENPTFPGIVIEDVGNGTKRQGLHVNLEPDTREREEYEVERILIPGPPGSFLPSPGAVGSEEFQGNSSLTTSQVQSSKEQQELVSGDPSNSPISAMSTVSDSALAGSESKLLQLQELEEKAWSGSSSGGGIEPLVPNAALTPQQSTTGFSSESRSVGKGPLILKNDNQPCCCQRKERSSAGIVPNYPESQLLRRRNLSSLTAIGLGQCPNRSRNTTSIHVEGRHEMLPQSALENIESERTRSSLVPDPSKVSTDIGTKVSDRGDPDSSTPLSACNPVLRLMGKNLMVVNKEDALTPLGHSQSAASTPSNNPSSSRVSRVTDISCSRVPISSSGYQPAPGNKLKTVMEPPAAEPALPINWHVSGYSNGNFYFPNQPPRSNMTLSHSRDSRPVKEIIIIDDAPEDEMTNMQAIGVGHGGVLRGRQASAALAASFPMKTTVGYDPRLVGTFPFNYTLQDPSFFSQVPDPRRAAGLSATGVRWWSSLEGSGAYQQGHLVPVQSKEVRALSRLP